MRMKQTPHGSSSSHHPRGMATARLTIAEEEQFEDAGGDKSQESQDWLNLDNPKCQAATEGESETSKSVGKTSDQPSQAEGGAPAHPKDNPPAPTPSDPKPGTSKDPSDTSRSHPDPTQNPTQASTQNPEEETSPDLTEYVKSYQQAGKQWLDTVLENKEQAYNTLFDTLLQLDYPHIDKLADADRQTVLKCIKDRTARFLSEDDFAMYVELEEADTKKPQLKHKGDTKEALNDYYNAVHTLCEAQTNLMASTKVLEEKIKDKAVFLDIIKQVQLPVVQVLVRTVEEIETLEGKTYRELTLLQHLPDYREINPNATEQMRTMATFMYYVLYEQITGLQKSQTGCAAEFRRQTIPFKRLITGKKQPGRPGRSSETGKSRRKLEDIAAMEGATPAKQKKVTPKPTHRKGKGRGRGKKGTK